MKLRSIFQRQSNRARSPSWAAARVQYDSIDRRRVARLLSAPQIIAAEQKFDSVRSTVGLIIVSVGAYILGLAIGSAPSQNVIIDSPVEQRTTTIAQTLASHPVDSLVGDFWRILPVQQTEPSHSELVPLDGCRKPARTASTEYRTRSFAYLLAAESNCTLEQVTKAYGQPTVITITEGSIERPVEQILFYDDGVEMTKQLNRTNANDAQTSGALLSVAPDALPNTTCPGKRTIMQVVAHEDDDLLFLSPDLLRSIRTGDCVRTIYLTAGDAGSSKFYWLSRERGSEAAYAQLDGLPDAWNNQTVRLGAQRFVTVANQEGGTQISLAFMHLPDGKPDGQGFQTSNFDSLAKIKSGERKSIRTVDGQSTYSYAQLLNALRTFMELYQPDEVRTQAPLNTSAAFSDHSDHLSAGQITTAAFKSYRPRHPVQLRYYTGYPIREQPVNVEGDELSVKQQAFFTYAIFDGAVCNSVESCTARGDYGEYLQRQYRTDP